ncbi:tyrosine-protein phosphatase [Chryseobacterium sp.]|uniref:tyrosine-protein phosphatase n=1 Tax=Chryseobacterium sp. TaxID=1871047 RepID=UPI0025BE3F63|nr:tyrosine-protein phosphatase [Chryseobacterium sp.]MBV8328077.1 tyrosine-protein phosphatase [Chryseobacterium sp.]
MKNILYILLLLLPALFYSQVNDSLKRKVPMEGAINFRDIGGYTTKDGKNVKWGKIYRSAALNKLTSHDTIKLKQLGIKTVFDFRGPSEIAVAKDNLPKSIDWTNLPAGSENLGKTMLDISNEKKIDSLVMAIYTDLPNMTKRYQPVFQQLLTSDDPILYHCAAGKDRTGIATALVLYALGVPESKIMEDYLASNYYRQGEINKLITIPTKNGMKAVPKVMQQVKAEWLEATANAIIRQYGSVEAYLRKEMQVGPEQIKILRKKFLE